MVLGILLAQKRVIETICEFSDDIDKFIFNSCMDLGVYPSPLNYRGFPKSVCTSVNNCVCHGIPDLRPMKDGDIVRYTRYE